MALTYDDRRRTRRTKWHMVNGDAARPLMTITNSPGVAYGMATTELPDQLKPTDAASYYKFGHGSLQALEDGHTVCGELLLTRVEREITKNYQYAVATSRGGNIYFTGPYKGFREHHVVSGQNIPVNSLFGHTPFSR